jgi:hypothetical protein
MGPIVKRVRSCQDQTLRTGFGVYNLVKGEVFEGRFKSESNLHALISIGLIELAINSPIKKEIPVIVPVIIPELPLVLKELPVQNIIIENIPSSEVDITLLDAEGKEIPLSYNIDKFKKV